MKLFSLLLFFFAGLALASGDLLQFKDMIKHMTGRSASSYITYGCYCGWGGSKKPLDATDRCCHAHDCCYKRVSSLLCSPKVAHYKFSLLGHGITCGAGTPCQRATCACDKAAAECFHRVSGSYNNAYTRYPNYKCKGRAPSC